MARRTRRRAIAIASMVVAARLRNSGQQEEMPPLWCHRLAHVHDQQIEIGEGPEREARGALISRQSTFRIKSNPSIIERYHFLALRIRFTPVCERSGSGRNCSQEDV